MARTTSEEPSAARSRRARLCVLLTGGAALLALVAGAVPASPAPVSRTATVMTATANPLARLPFYVDPHTRSAWAVRQHPETAAAISTIASTAQAHWVTSSTATVAVQAEVNALVTAAAALRQMPTLVVYAIPHRDCGSFSAGGLAGPAAYAAWVAQVVKGIQGRPATVVLEPDALAGEDCLTPADRTARNRMLIDAVHQLTASSSTALYVDVGQSAWLSPAEAVRRLNLVDVGRARGFSLNVSNFYPTADEIAYGERVSSMLGGKHYVVDTSRNGRGHLVPRAPLDWCNPPGRGLGVRPTARTAGAHADAYLWIKHPGESDGDCHRGDPPSGTWFEDYAVGLVRRGVTG